MNTRGLRRSLIAAALTASLTVTGAQAKSGGEPKPNGYGRDVCVTMLHDMSVSRQAYSDRDYDFRLNLVGCDAPWETLNGTMHYQSEPCPTAARNAGNRLVRKGFPTRQITPKVIGRQIGGEGTVVEGVDCTLYEDWSWG